MPRDVLEYGLLDGVERESSIIFAEENVLSH